MLTLERAKELNATMVSQEALLAAAPEEAVVRLYRTMAVDLCQLWN